MSIQTAPSQNGASPQTQGAGFLVSTGVGDAPIDGAILKKAMLAEGLPTAMIPDVPSEVDAFMRACASVATKREKLTTRVTVGRVKEDVTECVYQLTVEAVDKANRVIDHPRAMLAVYDKAAATGRSIRFEATASAKYDGLDPENALRLQSAIHVHFDAHRGRLPGSKVRAILRQSFRSMHATRWSTTNSVFFVPPEHEGAIDAMRRILTAVYGTAFEYDKAELAGTKANMQTIADKHEASVREEAEKMMETLRDRLADPAEVRQNTLAKFMAQRAELSAMQARMDALLGREQNVAQQALSLVDVQIAALTERAK
jgi:hypothetical protein